MQREQTTIPRLTLERGEPLVPCAYADGLKDRWGRKIQGCGTMVPYGPRHLCPNCGNRMVKSNPLAPGPDSRVIHDNAAIIDSLTGKVVVLHIVCASDLATDLAGSLSQVKWDDQVFSQATTTSRLSGMATTHRTFGYQPPVPMRRRYGCSRSQFNSEYPEAMNQIAQFCRVAEHMFRTHASDVHDLTANKVRESIPPAWLIAGTPWSSGIINKTVSLPYHRDQANVPSSWSAMLGCRRQVEGGFLHLADYDTYLAIPHGSITIFDGQSITHGVTPFKMLSPAAFRYTLVTYAKQGMKKCCPDPKDEARRAALEATEAEDKRAGGFKVSRKPRRYA